MDFSENDVLDEVAHSSLLRDIKKLGGSNSRFGEEKEIRLTSEGSIKAIDTRKLLKILDDRKLVKKRKISKKLEKPLEKPTAKRLKRAVGYQEVSQDVNKWEGIINRRRRAEHLSFPLEEVHLREKTSEQNSKPIATTELQKDIYNLFYGESLAPPKYENEQEKEKKKAMSLKEVKMKSKELWQQRKLRERLELKAARRNKSKSRKFHRIQKRERMRNEKQEFQALKSSDPQAALEKLEEIELARIEERMSQRHRASKWVHLQKTRSGHDPLALSAVEETREICKELTEKLNIPDDVDSDDNERDEILKRQEKALQDGAIDSSNPWASQLALPPQKVKGPDGSLRKLNKFWENYNLMKEADKNAEEIAAKNLKEMQEEDSQKDVNSSGIKESIHEYSDSDCSYTDLGNEETSLHNLIELDKKRKSKKKSTSMREANIVNPKMKKDKLIKKLKKNNDLIENNEIGADKSKIAIKKKLSDRKSKKTKKVKITKKVDSDDDLDIDDLFKNAEKKLNKAVKKRIKSLEKKIEEEDEDLKVVKEPSKLEKKKKNDFEFDFSAANEEELLDEGLNRARTLSDMDKLQENKEESLFPAKKSILYDSKKNESTDEAFLTGFDVTKIISRKLNPGNHKYSFGQFGDISSDENDELQGAVNTLCEDEDLVNEFVEEKKKIDEDQKKKLTEKENLKGWGSWLGPDGEQERPKRNPLRTTSYERPRNKHSAKPHIIYNEAADMHPNIRSRLVSELPHPFTSVKDFEASIRQPITRQFVPELVHKKLIAKPIIIKMGTVIKPMTEEALITNRNQKNLMKRLNFLKTINRKTKYNNKSVKT